MLRCAAVPRRITGFIILAVLLVSCAAPAGQTGPAAKTPIPTPSPTPLFTPTPVPTLPQPQTYIQAPSLEPLVQSGVLPPLNQRLPVQPMVVRPVDQVGKFGGTWHMVIRPYADQAQLIRTVSYEPLVRWTRDWSGLEPNLAESYSANRQSTEYTFKLRRWVRWSDGSPFTTADIRFWYNEILLNPELTPLVPSWLKSRGKVAEFEFIDDVTFKVHFPYPNSLFLEQLASPEALMITAFQANYTRGFHKNYVQQDELEKAIAEGGFDSWAAYFKARVGVNSLDNGNFVDPARPRLTPWVLADPYMRNAKFVTWERNPYYWKVDPAGNQLPYIDSVRFEITGSVDEVISQALQGKIDMQNLSAMGVDSAALFSEGQENPYNLYKLKDGSNNLLVINLNLATNDLTKRQVFRSKEFRIGLSYAINRQEIIDTIYHGQGKAWQAAPRDDSVFYDPAMATQYTEFDQAKANEYLEKAGLQRNQLGQWLTRDGLPVTFSILVLESEPQQVAALNLISRQLAEVGIDVQTKVESLPIFLATVRSNLHDAVAWRGGGTYFYDVLLSPSSYIASNDEAFWAVTWADWYNKVPGYEDVNPEHAAQLAMLTYDRIRSVSNTNEQVNLMKSALVMARESFWTIGVALGPDQYTIAKKNFHNLPIAVPSAWIYPDPGPVGPEQFYIQ